MRNTPGPNDSRLWALFADEFRTAGVQYPADALLLARRAVAVVRRERDQTGTGTKAGRRTWAPGDEIPDDVMAVYDLDGDKWTRDPGGRWSLPTFDPAEVEEAAGRSYDSRELLLEYGPATEAKRRVSGA